MSRSAVPASPPCTSANSDRNFSSIPRRFVSFMTSPSRRWPDGPARCRLRFGAGSLSAGLRVPFRACGGDLLVAEPLTGDLVATFRQDAHQVFGRSRIGVVALLHGGTNQIVPERGDDAGAPPHVLLGL